MFRLCSVLLVVLMFSVNVFARFGRCVQVPNKAVSNQMMLQELDMLADEIEDYAHRPEAMNRAFFQLAQSAKILKIGNFVKPAVVTDAHLLNIAKLIANKIKTNTVSKLNKLRIRSRIILAGRRLESNRINVAPVLLGELEISGADPLNFGATLAGFPSQTTLTVTNIGDGPVTQIEGLAFDGPFNFYAAPYPGLTGTCDSDLAVGESCTLNIQFDGPVVRGFYEGQLNLEYFDGKDVQLMTKGLQGTSL